MKKNKKRKKWKRIVLVLVIVVLIIGFIVLRNSKKSQNAVPIVEVTKAMRGDLQEELIIEGSVGGEDTVTLYAPANGEVKDVFVRTGDEVLEGTLIATYDLDKMEGELYRAQLQNERTQISYENTLDGNSEGNSKVREANTNLAVLKQQIKDHENYLSNLQKELSDYIQKQSNDQVLLNYNLKKRQAQLQEQLAKLTPGTEEYEAVAAELESVINQLEQLTLNQSLSTKTDYQADLEKKITKEQETLAELREYQGKMESQKVTGEARVLDDYGRRQLEIDMELTNLSYQKMLEEAELAKKGVVSTVKGVIVNLAIQEKGPVSSGLQIVTIERTDRLKISATATSYALERLKVGQKVDAVIGKKTYSGEVTHIDKFSQQGVVKGTMSVGFEVTLDATDDPIYLGSNAKMTIYANKAENALILPTQAVRADKNGDFVYVVQNGAIVRKEITCGIITNGKAEILSGITEADEVVADYQGDVREGTAVITEQAEHLYD